MGRLGNKVALVVGAGGSREGLSNGKAVAVLFAREGAHVLALDINREAVEGTCAVIRQEGGRCDALIADATSSEAISGAVETAMGRCGRIDILHNNVGRPIMGDPVAMSEADWQRSIEINLNSAFLACKQVLPIMLSQGAGAIVNVSSLASIQVNAYPYFGYLAAKAGLNQFTRAIAVTLRPPRHPRQCGAARCDRHPARRSGDRRPAREPRRAARPTACCKPDRTHGRCLGRRLCVAFPCLG